MPKLEKGDISRIGLQSSFVIQTVYKGVPQRHYLQPRDHEAGFVLSALNGNGTMRTITTLDNPYAGKDTGAGNRWAELAVSDLLESMYRIVTPAREREMKEFLLKIKSVPIIEYASALGFTLTRRGHYYSTKEHDSMSIDPDKNYYWRNSQVKSVGVERGSVIDFAIRYDPAVSDKRQAISKLRKMVNISEPVVIRRPERDKGPVALNIPPKSVTMKHVFAYLVQTRKIDSKIIQWFVDHKKLYEDKHRNCVFVSYDKSGKENFISVRGTNTYKRFVRDAEGCDYNACYYIDNHSKTLISNEAVIDSMSVMSLLKHRGRNWQSYNYLALSGTEKWPSVLYHLKQDPSITTLVLAYDDDEAGWKANLAVKQALDEKKWPGKIVDFVPKREKDWNDEWKSFLEPKKAVQLDNRENPSPEKQDQQRPAVPQMGNSRGRELER